MLQAKIPQPSSVTKVSPTTDLFHGTFSSYNCYFLLHVVLPPQCGQCNTHLLCVVLWTHKVKWKLQLILWILCTAKRLLWMGDGCVVFRKEAVTELCCKLLFSDSPSQKAVQPLYTEVYAVLRWWMQHVCDPGPSPQTLCSPQPLLTEHLPAHHRCSLGLLRSRPRLKPAVFLHANTIANCVV